MKKTALLILAVIILCSACAARAEGKELPAFASIREALDSTEGYAEIREDNDRIVLILEMDGRYLRMVTFPDEYAKELYQAAETAEHRSAAMEAFDSYAWALPADYAEELPEAPKNQAELDGLKGKTLQELMDEGFGEMILPGDISEVPTVMDLEYGFYKYEFEVTDGASGYPWLMTVKSGKFIGLSGAAFDVDSQ